MPRIAYHTPGVYYERLDASAPRIAAIRTDVAGFVGLAERGPIDRRVPIQSWRQFQAHFGGFSGSAFLAYTVRAYFENGGRRCWVVRVASQDPPRQARPAQAVVNAVSGPNGWRIEASSPGVWGNQLTVEIREVRRAQTQTLPSASDETAAAVAGTSGFARRSLVRLSQATAALPQYRVVSDVDPVRRRLVWVHQDPAQRLPSDQPLRGFDLDDPLVVESIGYTILVRKDRRVVAVFDELSTVPGHENYAPHVLRSLYRESDLQNLPATPRPIVVARLDPEAVEPTAANPLVVPTLPIPLCGGADGLAALRVFDFIGEEFSPQDSDAARRHKRRGMRELDRVDEVSLIAVPDIHVQPVATPEKQPPEPCEADPCLPVTFRPPARPRLVAPPEQPPVFREAQIYQVQDALVRYCEQRGDRMAILDPPASVSRDDEQGLSGIVAWRSRFDSKYAALYYPWARVVDPLRRPGRLTRDVPPSGHVAGRYAGSDFEVGVHKAPANSPLHWLEDGTAAVGDDRHGLLNVRGINAIRALPGRGIRILGARTVSSDADWRYVNVVRLIMMIKKAVLRSLQWTVFEPNDTHTRAKLRLTLGSFLGTLWQQGALAGDAPEQAFFVRCDETNNPAEQRERGNLIADVGVAPAKPFEFVVLRVGRTANELELTESGLMVGAA